MSYPMSRTQAIADAKAADMQLDGNETSNTSPVLMGSSDFGGAPMSGEKMFTNARTRHKDKMVEGKRVEFPTEGMSRWGSKK